MQHNKGKKSSPDADFYMYHPTPTKGNTVRAKPLTLTDDQVRRATALYERVGRYAFPHETFDQWLAPFRYEQKPDNDFQLWERIAGAFEAVGGPEASPAQRTRLIHAFMLISLNLEDIRERTGFSNDAIDLLRAIYREQH